MKTFIVTLVIICVAATAGTIIYLDRQKVPVAPGPLVESSPEQASPEKIIALKPESPDAVSENVNAMAQIPPTNSVAENLNPNDSTNSIHKLVKALLSAKNGKQKQALFDQLRASGQFDQAIADLKQRAVDNPNDPEIPMTLGEAQLNEVQALHEASNDNTDQIGILAMQADQNFNAALKIDPSNWEAQFVKADSMFYWPSSAGQDNNVVQSLSSLIDQQETMTPQPQFAQTYVVLGDEYQKIGQPDKAVATWQLGLTKFPDNSTLQKRINNPPAQ
jgi:tetratricopeptide (TPR) repeat protein